MTNFGKLWRQFGIGLMVTARLTAWITVSSRIAHADGWVAHAHDQFNDQYLITQLGGAAPTMNQPTFTQPLLQPVLPGRNRSMGQQFGLWPGSVTWGRTVDFIDLYLQPDLRLAANYTYSFTFNLRARDKRAAPQSPPDGWYQLLMAVVLPEKTSDYTKGAIGEAKLSAYDRYVTSRSMFVQVTGGLVSREVTLNFTSLSATTVISHLFVEFIPLETNCLVKNSRGGVIKKEESCIHLTHDGKSDARNSILRPLANYKPYIIDIPFVPYVPGGQSNGNPDDAPRSPNPEQPNQSLEEYIVMAKTESAVKLGQPRTSISPSSFAEQYGLDYYSVHDPIFGQSNSFWLRGGRAEPLIERLLDTPGAGMLTADEDLRKLMPVLCTMLARQVNLRYAKLRGVAPQSEHVIPITAFMHCQERPEEVFGLARVTHVYSFAPKLVESKFEESMRYSIQSNSLVSRNRGTDVIKSWNLASTVFRLFDSYGVAIGGLGYTVQNANGRSKSDSASGSLSTTLDFNMIGMNVPLRSYQRCIDVRPLRGSDSLFVDATQVGARNGFYICGDRIDDQPRSVAEIYAHVFAHSGDTSIVDSYKALSQTINDSLRGDRDISAFFLGVRQGLTPDHNNRIQPFQMLERAAQYFASTPLTDFGIIVNPITFANDPEPSLAQKLLGTYSEKFIDD